MVPVKNLALAIFVTGIFRCSFAEFSQDDLNYIGQNLELRYDVLDNLEDQKTFKWRIILTNVGSRTIKRGPWAMYFNFIRMIEPVHLMNNASGYVINKLGLKFAHVTGSLFKMEPVEGFQAMVKGKRLVIDLHAQDFSVSRTDAMPNWYVAADGLQARNITSTTSEDLAFVGNFDTKEKWKRYTYDLYDPFTPEERLARITARDKRTVSVSVIPTPLQMKVNSDLNVNISDWVIVTSKRFYMEAMFLGEKLKLEVYNESDNKNIPKSKMIHISERNITVHLNGSVSKSDERYFVNVSTSDDIIVIAAVQPSGAFHGVQTLLSVVDFDRKVVPEVMIRDSPRFEYRGLMLDIARNFHGKACILRLMDAMAMYKMNKLHLHLSDDEGWRLEIPGLEELTHFGGKRCHNTEMCLAPQIGSGASLKSSGTGYLTVEDYKEILAHGRKLHIEIIPEFDMPGHSHAAVKAMEYRYKKNNGSKNQTVRENAGKYLLSEPGDTSKYLSVEMFRDNAVNPCLNSTYDLIEHIVVALTDIHKDVSPLNVFHMGGDEVAKGAWLNSSACQHLISEKPQLESIHELKRYFVHKLSKLTSKYNVDLAVWEDGLIYSKKVFNRTTLLNSHIFSYAWDNVWEWGAFNRAYLLANAGYKTVMCQATHLYFDMPYEPDPEERGYYWATRYTDTQKTFGFMPDDLYANAEVKLSGEAIIRQDLCKSKSDCPSLVERDNIIGMQGHLWSETVRTEDQLFYMLFPRMLALAERAWHKATFENLSNKEAREIMKNTEWEAFANILGYKELKRLDTRGIKYRIPVPGAKIRDGKLVAKSTFPGLKLEYSLSDKKQWLEYEPGVEISGKTNLRTRSADGRRTSREIQLEALVPTTLVPSSSANPSAEKIFISVNTKYMQVIATIVITITYVTFQCRGVLY